MQYDQSFTTEPQVYKIHKKIHTGDDTAPLASLNIGTLRHILLQLTRRLTTALLFSPLLKNI